MPRVSIDPSGRLVRNGQPFFPLGARHVPRGANAAMLASIGFNCLRVPVFGTDTTAIGVMQTDPSNGDYGGLLYYPYLYDRADFSTNADSRRRDLSRLVSAIRDDERLLCYEQKNEPSTTFRRPAKPSGDPEGLREGSNHLRSLDCNHPIRVGHMTNSLVRTLKRYNPAVDIVGCNPYPVSHPEMRMFVGCRGDGKFLDSPNQTLSAVGDYTDKMRRVAEGRPVWMQIQAMPNEYWFSETHTPENVDLGLYPHHVVAPTFWQMRFMAMHAIIHGSAGLEFAMYGVSVDDSGWSDVVRTIRFLNMLLPILSAETAPDVPNLVYEEIGFSDWTGVEVLGKRTPGGTVLLTANSQFDPFIATLDPTPKGDLYEALEDGRWVRIGDGSSPLRYQPYQVRVIRIGAKHAAP